MHNGKVVLQQMFSFCVCLSQELLETRKTIVNVVSTSSAAYDARLEESTAQSLWEACPGIYSRYYKAFILPLVRDCCLNVMLPSLLSVTFTFALFVRLRWLPILPEVTLSGAHYNQELKHFRTIRTHKTRPQERRH